MLEGDCVMDDQKILDNAPEGATHIDTELTYWDIRACNDNPLVWDDEKWFATDDIPTAFALLRPLADIKELVELRAANAELEKEIDFICVAIFDNRGKVVTEETLAAVRRVVAKLTLPLNIQ
tara:strand:- start:785 stop:1150 length:366 start_codon:yes stop_codon:yes gene_type:complete